MFEAIELGQSLSKADFKTQEQHLRAELLKVQRDLVESRIATLIIVAGVEGAGKGEVVDRLNKWFDNRGMETHAFWDETQEELERPQHWRFWRHLPGRGSIAVMFGGMLIIKLWFHLSHPAHEKRMKKRRAVSRHVPHVGNGQSPKEYKAFLVAADGIPRRDGCRPARPGRGRGTRTSGRRRRGCRGSRLRQGRQQRQGQPLQHLPPGRYLR